MKHSSTTIHRFANSKALHTVVFAIATLSLTLNGWSARAANVLSTDYRFATADDKSADAWQCMSVFKVRPKRRLRVKRVELVIGTFSTSQKNRLFVSLGPMQRPLVIHDQNVVAGLTNRLLARLARDVLPAFPGNFPANMKTKTVGLSSSNPGMDMTGLNISCNSFDQ